MAVAEDAIANLVECIHYRFAYTVPICIHRFYAYGYIYYLDDVYNFYNIMAEFGCLYLLTVALNVFENVTEMHINV